MVPKQIRQGDVLLQPVSFLPEGCKEIAPAGGGIVLAYGETTGHAHAIYDYIDDATLGAANKIASAAIFRAKSKARLLVAPNGEQYLEVIRTVTLKHEEHTRHMLPPGINHLPVQM